MPKRRIFVVDDEERIIDLLKFGLEMSGYEVLTAHNGREALEKIPRTRPDLIISDVMMPHLDGFELCEKLRENPETKLIPFIFLTAKGQIPEKLEGIQLGADDYITKPFDLQELIARMESILYRMELASQTVSEEVAMSGKLSQMEIIDVIQTLQMGEKTGQLMINRGSNVATIYFMSGEVIDAKIFNLVGEKAFYRILTWQEGSFAFDPNAPLVKRTIFTSTQNLLMEGLKHVDRLKQAKELPPSLSTMLVQTGKPANGEDLSEEEMAVYNTIDGKRDMYAIISSSKLGGQKVFQIVSKLLSLDLVEPLENY
jgi:DNA-binding response OmpR family regulator